MSTPRSIDLSSLAQIVRYVINGALATLVHYSVLTFNLKVLHVPYAGVANLFAAAAGILTSFAGSRYFVFQASDKPVLQQFAKFGLLYACIAVLHACVLWGWTDVGGFDYRWGFLLATVLQMILSFWGNKRLVFK